MNKHEAEQLSRLLQAQFKLGQRVAEQHAAALLADAEAKLAARFSPDEAWLRDLRQEGEAAIQDLDAKLARRCRERGIQESFRPRFFFDYMNRGENAFKERRAELRRVAQTRVDELKKAALVTLETHIVDARTRLAAGMLTSEDAKQFLASLPDVKQLMPPLDVDALAPRALGGGVDEDQDDDDAD